VTKVAIVTGSSSGIGAATAQLLAQSGWAVLGVDRQDASTATPGVTHHACDLADPAAVAEAAAAALQLGPVTAVVHCAATQPLGAAGEVDDDAWQQALAVNLLAVERLVAATRESLRRTRGAVAVISSVHAVATTRQMAAYATSKAALEGWVRAAALDLAPEVRVNAVRPGAVDTPMLRAGFARRPEDGTPDEAFAKLAASVPLNLVIDPADIARAVLLLVDDTRPWPATGSVVTLDGGALLGLSTE
jgi:NAD(P)-dependent dehydrogenase (short-subunit alcohol dehydrogenase family)